MNIEELLDTSFFHRSLSSSFTLSCWCCPAFAPAFAGKIIGILQLLRHPLDYDEQDQLIECIRDKMSEGWGADSHSDLIVSINIGIDGIAINFFLSFKGLADTYSEWYSDKDRKDIMFGRMPDVKVIELAESLTPKTILDLGAGDGRNALGLVRQYQGLAVDLVELTPAFFSKIIEQVEQENLPVRGVCADILDPSLTLENNYYDFIFCSEVLSHFRLEGLHNFFDRCYQWIKPDGVLLINLFLADDNHIFPDKFRQMGERVSSCFFTRSELLNAIDGKFEIDSIQDCLTVELPHQDYFPHWYKSWASGKNILSTYPHPIPLKWVSLLPINVAY